MRYVFIILSTRKIRKYISVTAAAIFQYHHFAANRKAINHYEQALAIDEKVYGNEHPDVARELNNLGVAYYHMGQKEKAKPYFQNAYAIFNKFYGEEHPDIQMVKEWLDDCK